LAVARRDDLHASVRRGSHCAGGIVLTVSSAALEQLPPLELQGMMAHELAHVVLGQLPETGGFGARPFRPEEEAAADRMAARLLARIGDGAACSALAELFARLGRDGARRPAWPATHPSLADRAEQVRAVCEEAPR
jgi:Zn-dependent protease with chaperone function